MWLSILKTTHSPSPMSTTPAFSPGPWITRGPGGRQRLQPFLRGFVRAVLVPHRREDAELGEARLAADQVEDALVFVGLQPVRGDEFRRDRNGSLNGHGMAVALRVGAQAPLAQAWHGNTPQNGGKSRQSTVQPSAVVVVAGIGVIDQPADGGKAALHRLAGRSAPKSRRGCGDRCARCGRACTRPRRRPARPHWRRRS